MTKVSAKSNIHLTVPEIELIEKAHPGYENIILEKEFRGGFSDTRVFLALPVKTSGARDARLVTKIGLAADLHREKDNYDQFAGPALPFATAQVKNYTEIDLQAAINYTFAGGGALGETMSLEDYYLTQSAGTINKTFDTLLDQTIGDAWYGQNQALNCLFSDEYGRHLRPYTELKEIVDAIYPQRLSRDGQHIQIPGLSGVYPEPLVVFPDLLDRTLKGRRSFVHGDLHIRNVLVDEQGRGWLIDFAKVKERHNLFDFIKLETYLRLMALPQVFGAFSLNEYVQFEQALNAVTLGRAATAPVNSELVKASQVIQHIRQIARKYMGYEANFKNEYFPALFLYALSMLKYFPVNKHIPTQLMYLTSCRLAVDIFEENKPMKPVLNEDQNQSEEKDAKPSPSHSEKTYSATNTGSGAIAQGDNAKAMGAGGISISGNGNVFVSGKDNKVNQTTHHVNTGGGAYIGGNINVKNGDFVGGNKITNSSGTSTDEIAVIFAQLLQRVDKIHDDSAKTIAQIAVKELKVEAEKGPLAAEKNVDKWFNSLSLMAPDIWEVAIDAFSNPIKGISTVFQKIAQHAKDEKARKSGS